MNELAVTVETLGKQYQLGYERRRYPTFRDTIVAGVAGSMQKLGRAVTMRRRAAAARPTVWALRDLSFDVRRGEVIGIIGRNGAGKSTLLKILSRITEPTEGAVELTGRVASLLEVGTGFHPELTGRENVYLNGAILGMHRTEIGRNFDRIVAFAEVERFLDTPVKHYSSGMYLRLAFAVAAHLQPEILVVDEVLAVGDAAFQKKCLGQMGEVAQSGRTVLFVSHNMAAITELCPRAIWLENGRLQRDGHATEVVSAYLSDAVKGSHIWSRPAAPVAGDAPDISLSQVSVVESASGLPAPAFDFHDSFRVEIQYRVNRPTRDAVILYSIFNDLGTTIWTAWDTDGTGLRGEIREPGEHSSICNVPAGLLRPGRYRISVCAQIPNVRIIDSFDDVVAFDVSTIGFPFNFHRRGTITPVLQWHTSLSAGVEPVLSTATASGITS